MQLKFIKKNKKAFKNIPDIKNRINKNKKLIKLKMMLLIDIVKTKIQLNYYLFKTF